MQRGVHALPALPIAQCGLRVRPASHRSPALPNLNLPKQARGLGTILSLSRPLPSMHVLNQAGLRGFRACQASTLGSLGQTWNNLPAGEGLCLSGTGAIANAAYPTASQEALADQPALLQLTSVRWFRSIQACGSRSHAAGHTSAGHTSSLVERFSRQQASPAQSDVHGCWANGRQRRYKSTQNLDAAVGQAAKATGVIKEEGILLWACQIAAVGANKHLPLLEVMK